VDTIAGDSIAFGHWVLNLLSSSKEHINGERSFHKLDYLHSRCSRVAGIAAKSLGGNEMRPHEAGDVLAACLQQSPSDVLNPGVGRLRRAEAGSGSRATGGPGWAPFFL
jgi:hypothetical protein